MHIIQALESTFQYSADAQKSHWQEAYMRNQFHFLGIPRPLRAQIEKEIFKKYPLTNQQELIDILTLLWEKEAREFQYTACNLAYRHKSLWNPSIITLFEHMICTKSWWDTVDDIAANLLGTLLLKHQDLITDMDAWINNENLWIRRSVLLYQLRWKQKTDEERLFSYCVKTMHEKDFFIRKAIGWVLREYSKTNSLAVRTFITKNHRKLSPLSIREGSKYL